jgi:hypothetical protein
MRAHLRAYIQELRQSNAELEATMHVALETSSNGNNKKVKQSEELTQVRAHTHTHTHVYASEF